jgi:hypothetical protein
MAEGKLFFADAMSNMLNMEYFHFLISTNHLHKEMSLLFEPDTECCISVELDPSFMVY